MNAAPKATQDESFALRINIENCGECVFCLSVCPFEALTRDEETKEILLDQEKCRLCGICAATCPSRLITIDYYSTEGLTEFLQKEMEKTNCKQVRIACRGTGLTKENWREKLGVEDTTDTLFFTLPCLGRISLNFLMNSIEMGIEKITLNACDEEFCRNKDGSKNANNKFVTAQTMFEDMGYYPEMIDFGTRAPKAEIDDTKCIACGTCAFICPYDAIKIEKSAILDNEKCMGCGQCVPSCPAVAITLEDSPTDDIIKEITEFASTNVSPKLLVLGCQWSEYETIDKIEKDEMTDENVKFIKMPCSGRIDILHILKALSAGIDGVLLSICIDDICSLETGNKWTKARVADLKSILEKLELSERVEICSAHPKYLKMYENKLSEFRQKVEQLGTSPIKGMEVVS